MTIVLYIKTNGGASPGFKTSHDSGRLPGGPRDHPQHFPFLSLKRFGLLWQRSPLELTGADRSKLWEKSEPSDHFDVFLSHTWRTRGGWKVLSLLFQYCWPIVMLCWLCVVAVVFLLSCLGALPMPLVFKINVLGFEAACPAAPWALLSGSVAVLISLLLSPYILCNSPKCFLDVVSIHQTDSELMERGVCLR